MKYLLVSDIHGSLPALEKVLDFYHQQHCDMMCIMGDILNYGPRNGLPEGLNPKAIAEKLNAIANEIVAVEVTVTLKLTRCCSPFLSCKTTCFW